MDQAPDYRLVGLPALRVEVLRLERALLLEGVLLDHRLDDRV